MAAVTNKTGAVFFDAHGREVAPGGLIIVEHPGAGPEVPPEPRAVSIETETHDKDAQVPTVNPAGTEAGSDGPQSAEPGETPLTPDSENAKADTASATASETDQGKGKGKGPPRK